MLHLCTTNTYPRLRGARLASSAACPWVAGSGAAPAYQGAVPPCLRHTPRMVCRPAFYLRTLLRPYLIGWLDGGGGGSLFSAAQILECEFAPPCYRGGPHLGQLLHFFLPGWFFLLYFASSYNYYFSEYCFSLPCGFFLELWFINFHFVSCGIRSAFLFTFISFYLLFTGFPFLLFGTVADL